MIPTSNSQPPTSKNDGQVMFLTVLVLSAVFLSVTVIAGLLMVYQLGRVTRIADSTKAIFAADAALERGLFNVVRCNSGLGPQPESELCDAAEKSSSEDALVPDFYNDAAYQMTIYSAGCGTGGHDEDADLDDVDCIRTTGRAGKSARAFEINFSIDE